MSVAHSIVPVTIDTVLDEMEVIDSLTTKIESARTEEIALWKEREDRYRVMLGYLVKLRDSGVLIKDIVAGAKKRKIRGLTVASNVGYIEVVGRILMKPGVLDQIYILFPVEDHHNPTYVRPDGSEGIVVRAAVRRAIMHHNRVSASKDGKKMVDKIVADAKTKNEAIQEIRSLFPTGAAVIPTVDALLRIAASNVDNAATHHLFPTFSTPNMVDSIARIRTALDAIESRWTTSI